MTWARSSGDLFGTTFLGQAYGWIFQVTDEARAALGMDPAPAPR